jgi:energy-coupling factor transporter transmembrane protein EcfT
MKSLLAPVVGCFSLLVEKYLHTSDQAHLDVLAQSLNTAMLVASRVSKGFSLQVKLKDCDSVDIFLEILRIFMPCVNICAHKTLIQAAFRQYLHRMLVCLDAEIIDYLPLTIGALLIKYNNNNNSSQQITCEQPKDLADLIPLLNQCINKLKVQAVPFVESILMILINLTLQFLNLLPSDVASNLFKSPHLLPIKSLHSTLIVNNNNNNNSKNLLNLNPINNNNNTESTSLILNSPSIVIIIDPQFVLDTQFLYKSCVQFLLNVANNDLMEIVANQAPDDIYKIFSFLLQAAQIGTQDVAKICFQAIKKYILALADKPNQIPNFIQYLMENVVPCCIQLLIRPSVDLNDAQHIFAFNEIANCLIYLYTKFGADFINYLEFNILPQLQLSQQFNQILIELIKTNNVKGFKVLREHIKGQAQS